MIFARFFNYNFERILYVRGNRGVRRDGNRSETVSGDVSFVVNRRNRRIARRPYQYLICGGGFYYRHEFLAGADFH